MAVVAVHHGDFQWLKFFQELNWAVLVFCSTVTWGWCSRFLETNVVREKDLALVLFLLPLAVVEQNDSWDGWLCQLDVSAGPR